MGSPIQPRGKADDGDSQLDAVDDFVKITMQFLDSAGADAVGFDELLNARITHAHQGELRRREERVGCNQQQDQEHPEEHKGDHGWLILTFQRGTRWRLKSKTRLPQNRGSTGHPWPCKMGVHLEL